MKTTQQQMIIRKLIKDGFVSRNWALSRFCSRLGARIADCKAMGMDIEGRYVKTRRGQDYVYRLINTRG